MKRKLAETQKLIMEQKGKDGGLTGMELLMEKVKADLARREDKSSNRSTKKESTFSLIFTVHPEVKHSAIFRGTRFDMFYIVYTLICFQSKIQKYSNRSFGSVCNRGKEVSVYDAGIPHGVCLIC